jgi:hypothetical protein
MRAANWALIMPGPNESPFGAQKTRPCSRAVRLLTTFDVLGLSVAPERCPRRPASGTQRHPARDFGPSNTRPTCSTPQARHVRCVGRPLRAGDLDEVLPDAQATAVRVQVGPSQAAQLTAA